MLNMHDLEASLSNTKIPQHSRNGHHFLQLEGMNASSNDPSAPQSTTSSHDVLASHLYHLGFVQGWFSDLHIRVQGFSGSASPSGGSWPQLSSGNGPVKSNASDPSTADVGSAPPNGASNGSPAGASQTSLFNHSFNSAQFQDGVLFKLHKIVAIRSPYLASLIQESEVRRPENFSGPTEIVLPISEPNLTPEGLSIAFGHLYANYSHGILSGIHTQPNPDVIDVPTVHRRSAVLRGVLLAASLLQLSDLAAAATEFIRQDLTRLSAPQYCRFVSQPPVLPATPTGSSGQADASASAALSSRMSEIREALYAFLSRGLVRELVKRYGVPIKWGSKDHESYRELVSAFADLPFEWLKRVVESKDDFEVPSDMERFSFAKDVVSLRAKQKQQNPSLLLAGEENVLLAFGGGKAGGSGVTIVRKAPKASPVHIGQQQLLQQHHSGFHQPSAPQQRMPYPSMPHHQHQANSQPHDMLGPFGFGQLYNGVDSNTAPNGTAHAGDDYRLQSSGSERKIWKASV
ncbi:hypothetical protein DFJ73DRAFT_839778 [Zopfochytrium polystomum]|nr:hypothetical protein DFJ73DRAFT_839778 [Zopfochytrium polystomum]